MVSIIKVTPLYILLSGQKNYRPIAFGSLEPIIKRTLFILFRRGDSVFTPQPLRAPGYLFIYLFIYFIKTPKIGEIHVQYMNNINII